MQRSIFCLTALLGILTACPASAQESAHKMFDKLDHDFGDVARGSDTVYKFEITNRYKEDVHVADVRSSCGCTTPSIENNTIKSWEKSYVVAKFNTRTFTGPHSATLTVTIDKPYYAQVQVRVHGNIRGDVTFEPGSVDFEKVDQGQAVEKRVTVTHSGRSTWRIEDVRSASEALEVELAERGRQTGRVQYDLLVKLKENAPAGYLNQQLVLVTNDSRSPRIPLDVTGQVVPEISVTPANVSFGETPMGESASKRIIVRGDQPFKITRFVCADKNFTFETDDESKERHIVEVKFNAAGEPGRRAQTVRVETDLGETYNATFAAYAVVKPGESAAGPEDSDVETDGDSADAEANSETSTR